MTNAEKEQLELWVHRYVNTGIEIPEYRYKRLMSWLADIPMAEIASEQGIGIRTVAESIRQDVKRIQEFARKQEQV